jgi:hypothetical protein
MSELINITRADIVVDSIPLDLAARILEKVKDIEGSRSFNIWTHFAEDNDFKLLGDAFIKATTELINFGCNHHVNFNLGRAWPHIYKDWEYTAPHHHGPAYHGPSFVVGVVYLDFSEGAGDLLIQDPFTQWGWIRREDNGRDARASMKFTPSVGKLVVMPGYILHSTEPKPAGKNRAMISTNIDLI